jgi:hypothetical protein
MLAGCLLHLSSLPTDEKWQGKSRAYHTAAKRCTRMDRGNTVKQLVLNFHDGIRPQGLLQLKAVCNVLCDKHHHTLRWLSQRYVGVQSRSFACGAAIRVKQQVQTVNTTP